MYPRHVQCFHFVLNFVFFVVFLKKKNAIHDSTNISFVIDFFFFFEAIRTSQLRPGANRPRRPQTYDYEIAQQCIAPDGAMA
jgi:hypothetical protein